MGHSGMYCLLGLRLACCIAGVSCQSCHENAGPNPDNPNSCACFHGYKQAGLFPSFSCVACPKGTFTTWRDMRECDDCPTVATTTGPASPSALHCVCEAGYTCDFMGTACAACPRSTYKTGAGAQQCMVCQRDLVRGMGLVMQTPPRLALIVLWSTVAQSKGSALTYNSSAGPATGKGAVVFDSTEKQYLQGCTYTFNINSGGFTPTPHTVKPPSLWCRCCRNHSEEGVGSRQPTE